MVHQRFNTRGIGGLSDVGSLHLPIRWRVDMRRARFLRTPERPWHEESLQVPLESIVVDPDKVLYWDNNPERENSLKRVSNMMASRAIPLTIAGGNTMRNTVDRLQNSETEAVIGYSYSRIDLARRLIAHLQAAPGERTGHHNGANLHAIFRYRPPEGEAFEALVEELRRREGN